MNFDDLKDQITEQLSAIWGEIQESSLYNNVVERFEVLSPAAQKLIIGSIAGIIGLIFLMIPLSMIDSSQMHVRDYEESRELIQELMKSSRNKFQKPPLPPGMQSDHLQGRVQSVLNSMGLLPEQKKSVRPVQTMEDNQPIFTSPQITQAGVEVSLSELNLEQVVDVGYRLESISPTVRLAGFEVKTSAGEDHYFDVKARLISYGIPQINLEPPGDEAKPRSGRRGK